MCTVGGKSTVVYDEIDNQIRNTESNNRLLPKITPYGDLDGEGRIAEIHMYYLLYLR